MWIRAALICFLLVFGFRPALAQDHDPASSDDAQRAASLIDEGVELRKAGKEREALAKYQETKIRHFHDLLSEWIK